MKYLSRVFIIINFLLAFSLEAQEGVVLDKVIAVVGDEIATKSELEAKYASFLSSGMPVNPNSKCEILEDILYSKILLNQAKVDSIEVTDAQVESETDRRLRYYVSQIGSEQAFEEYYKKPISQIKDELKESLREQLLIQGMQADITSNMSITPEEVQTYYSGIPEDSLPLINAEVEVAQIVAYAPTSQASIREVKEKLRNYRERVSEGEKFSTLAVLYSEDKGSALKGGEIGFVGKAEVEPEFAAAAFKLKQGHVSPIVKTRYGYHIIQLIERRGAKVNVRHILLKPKQDMASLEKAKQKLDSIATLIRADSISFEEAALRFSDHEETKKNGGILVNQYTASSMTAMDELDPSVFFVIDKMEEGELSEPVQIQDPRSKPGYRIMRLNKRTEPHRANLKTDYQKIKTAALAQKEQKVLEEWIQGAVEKTYVKIDPEYSKDCQFRQAWEQNTEN
jgi:peptidyl-prolyl cis-trans isomerase SurA